MSDPHPSPDPHDPHGRHGAGGDVDLTAAEYALGVLDGADHARARERTIHEPAFARDVEVWEGRLAGLVDEVREVSPPDSAWPRIERRLSAFGGMTERRLRRSLTMWRMSTGAAAAIAAGLAMLVVWPPAGSLIRGPTRVQPAAAPALLTARLAAPDGPTAFVAVLDDSRHELVLTPATIAATANRSPELWLIPDGGAPISLGVGTFQRSVRLTPHSGLGAAGRLTLAVTLEPVGGSPTGKPTGPVVAKGALEKV